MCKIRPDRPACVHAQLTGLITLAHKPNDVNICIYDLICYHTHCLTSVNRYIYPHHKEIMAIIEGPNFTGGLVIKCENQVLIILLLN